MTEKLYYKDSYIHEFSARVTACVELPDCYGICLDKTAFFPLGGGQPADSGYIGHAEIYDVQLRDGEIYHYSRESLPVGQEFFCRINWPQRLERMRNHTGEHIFSGLGHSMFGTENVGFHMGRDFMTIDFDKELSPEELTELETAANLAIRDNLPVECSFPGPEELAGLEYRSKLELREDVRIVSIPGVDCCACCAPHLKSSGQVGLLKVLEYERHRGGIRINIACGMAALENYRCRQDSVAAVSRLLSVPREAVAPAVEKLLDEQRRQKEQLAALSLELVELIAGGREFTEGNICLFPPALDEIACRRLANLLMEKCSGIAAVFTGDDSRGYRYIIGSRSLDLRAAAREINRGIDGRGGGSSTMIQGSAAAGRGEIESFISNYGLV